MTGDELTRCACGRVHAAVDWIDLQPAGMMCLDGEEVLDLRNCHCGSTISRAIARPRVANSQRPMETRSS